MAEAKTITFDIRKPKLAAYELWAQGVVQITWTYPGAPQDRPFTAIGRVTGHSVDGEGRDCFILRQLNPASRTFQARAIPLNYVTHVRTASYAEVPRSAQVGGNDG